MRILQLNAVYLRVGSKSELNYSHVTLHAGELDICCTAVKTGQLMLQWSYQDHAARSKVSGGVSTIGKWLLDTPLFEQAWGEVCSSPAKWWWSSFICTWTVILTAVIWRESESIKLIYRQGYLGCRASDHRREQREEQAEGGGGSDVPWTRVMDRDDV